MQTRALRGDEGAAARGRWRAAPALVRTHDVETPLRGAGRVAKRALDVAVAAAALVLLAPLLAWIAWRIRREGTGPVLFRQLRVTRGGRVFELLKFRSMHADAERDGPRWADDDDRRCTPFGRVLRAWSLDELPQLVNVLRGEMSLVGPRPEMAALAAEFAEEIEGYAARHTVKAGITGWAQVHGLRGNTCLARRLAHDLEYIRRWSFALDLAILVRTLVRLRP